ncbi:hypothetical protein BO71DRAFT_170048 [Aspergillus ellipticus CBS 707.79]|uniref:Uncharacterized protein n=1 Tax=Aspergillus ellipticus CBS 707.79 TaxID=1448320 RepID=A0A319EFN2_9EURO|nr:hypothetical protein BO71DRAFT_170048 [Aspergillus ellipticus CBS 707.79]
MYINRPPDRGGCLYAVAAIPRARLLIRQAVLRGSRNKVERGAVHDASRRRPELLQLRHVRTDLCLVLGLIVCCSKAYSASSHGCSVSVPASSVLPGHPDLDGHDAEGGRTSKCHTTSQKQLDKGASGPKHLRENPHVRRASPWDSFTASPVVPLLL